MVLLKFRTENNFYSLILHKKIDRVKGVRYNKKKK